MAHSNSVILAVNSALAGAQVTSIGCPGWGFLKFTSMTFGGGSPSRPAMPAAFCAFAAALHVDVVYATNSRRPIATKLSSSRSTWSSKIALATILPRKSQNGLGTFQSYW